MVKMYKMISLIPTIITSFVGISLTAPIDMPQQTGGVSKSIPSNIELLSKKGSLLPILIYIALGAAVFFTYLICRARRRSRTRTEAQIGKKTSQNRTGIVFENKSLLLKKRRPTSEEKTTQYESELVSLKLSGKLTHEAHNELNPQDLEFGPVIGKGFFGKVNKGMLKKVQKVAIKRARDTPDREQRELILDEIKFMCAIGQHPNVVKLIGAVTSQGSEAMIVTEYVDCGSLKDFLRRVRDQKKFTDLLVYNGNQRKTEKYNKRHPVSRVVDELSTYDLISFCYQIAKGMVYLASIPCVHRDLALRNVLLMSDGTIRICDFGLTRRHDNKTYYRWTNLDIALPYSWVAPECIKNKKFDEKSDIWAFAVSLFEMFSLGGTPYQGVLDIYTYLASGKRLDEPKYCHPKIYKFMKLCWSKDPTQRPDFEECTDFFAEHLKMFED